MRRRPPPTVRALAVAGTAVVLLASGCTGSDGGDDPAPTTTTTAPPNPELLDDGAAPRQELRLRLTEGDTATATLTVDLGVTQSVDGVEQVLVAPAVTQTVHFTVDRVDGDEAEISFVFTDVSVERDGTDLTDAEHLELTVDARRLVGVAGTGRIDDRGAVRAFGYDLPADLDPAVAASLDRLESQVTDLIVPLPPEPVGVGARWRVRSTTSLGGAELDQSVTYEITEITGDEITYTAVVDQVAEDQPLDDAALPDGATGRLVSSQVTGTSVGTMGLGSLAASTASTLAGTQVIDLRDGDDTVRLTQRLDLAVTIGTTG